MDQDLKGKTFLVTGASAGIGRATAQALSARGGKVVLAARSEEKTRGVMNELRRAIPGADLTFLQLDLGDLPSVKRAGESFLSSGERLDALVNNAGIGTGHGLTRDGFEITFGTNFLGPFFLTELLLPRLREAPQGRIVNVASRAADRVQRIDWEALRRPAPLWRPLGLYGVSKLMNVIHARELARRLSDTKVTTYSLHPGVVASDIWKSLPWPFASLMKRFMLSTEEGAKTSVYCATAPELSQVSGRYYDKCREVPPNPLAHDEALANELFARSEKWISEALARR